MAEYGVFVQAEEYEKLGSYALIGLPTELYEKRCPFLLLVECAHPCLLLASHCMCHHLQLDQVWQGSLSPREGD